MFLLNAKKHVWYFFSEQIYFLKVFTKLSQGNLFFMLQKTIHFIIKWRLHACIVVNLFFLIVASTCSCFLSFFSFQKCRSTAESCSSLWPGHGQSALGGGGGGRDTLHLHHTGEWTSFRTECQYFPSGNLRTNQSGTSTHELCRHKPRPPSPGGAGTPQTLPNVPWSCIFLIPVSFFFAPGGWFSYSGSSRWRAARLWRSHECH